MRNPQPEDITIAVVTVDDAIVPFTVDGPHDPRPAALDARSTIPFTWVEDDPLPRRRHQLDRHPDDDRRSPRPSRRRRASGAAFGGYALIGLLVGVVPVALGMLWLPSLRRADPRWLAAFMALTGGLLTFLAVDALAEALELQGALPGALGGPGLVLAGVAAELPRPGLGLPPALARGGRAPRPGRRSRASRWRRWSRSGIGIHNLSEGLAIGSSFARRRSSRSAPSWSSASWSTTSPRGSASSAPVADGRRVSVGRLAVLALVAGAPDDRSARGSGAS